MKRNHSFLVFFMMTFVVMTAFMSCNKFEGDQEIPAYIHVDTFMFTTDYAFEGAASHKITDVWLYIDGNLQGCYEMPATIPVLKRGEHSLMLIPGIKLNGNSSTRTINPFYKPYEIESFNLEEGVIDTILPTTRYYSKEESTIEFAFIEDFERGTNLEKTDVSDTTVILTDRDAPDAWQDAEGNSHHSGYVWIGDTIDFFCIKSAEEFSNLPNQGDYIFLEIDYKCTNIFKVGLLARTGGIEQIDLIYVNPSPKWNKIYVNLGPNITDYQEAQYFEFFIAGNLDGATEAEYYFDNIKLVYRD
ncbi:MAG: hypothetical protein E7067_02605 [Lentimicrobiaceae bacterium]|nr:hypothetical protein [Lentimicrobiaceae bacterium]